MFERLDTLHNIASLAELLNIVLNSLRNIS